MEDHEKIMVLASAVLNLLRSKMMKSDTKIDEELLDGMGVVASLYENGERKQYLVGVGYDSSVKFQKLVPGKLEGGDTVYFFKDKGDAVTKAVLNDKEFVEEL